MKQQDKIEQQREHFNGIAEEYYRTRSGGKARELQIMLMRELLQGVDISSLGVDEISVLEPMCGFGAGLQLLRILYPNMKMNYRGFDYSDEIIRLARQNEPEVEFFHQDVTTYNSSRQYDIVILIGGLHHVPDHARGVTKNLFGWVRDGGLFINIEPTYNNFITKYACTKMYERNPLFDEETERRFTLPELNGMYEEAGFRIIKQVHGGLLAYLLWYNPDALPFFNKGSFKTLHRVFGFDRHFFYNSIGRKLSIGTWTVLRRG